MATKCANRNRCEQAPCFRIPQHDPHTSGCGAWRRASTIPLAVGDQAAYLPDKHIVIGVPQRHHLPFDAQPRTIEHAPPAPHPTLPFGGEVLRLRRVLRCVREHAPMAVRELHVRTRRKVLRVPRSHHVVPRLRQPFARHEAGANHQQMEMRRTPFLRFQFPHARRAWHAAPQLH